MQESFSEATAIQQIMASPAYRVAYEDPDFLTRDELRPVRLQLELLKTALALEAHRITSTIVVFGSARILSPEVAAQRLELARQAAALRPAEDAETARQVAIAERRVVNARYYTEARRFGRLVSELCQSGERCEFVITTGGGPGIMEAANRGAHDAGGKSIGLNITLPMEQAPNAYITPGLCFQFHYFAIRKMHFLIRAKAMVAFPGGFGTIDELFETLTLVQTRKIARLPIVLCGREYWSRVLDFDFLVEEGTIAAADLSLFRYVETAEEAWAAIVAFQREAAVP